LASFASLSIAVTSLFVLDVRGADDVASSVEAAAIRKAYGDLRALSAEHRELLNLVQKLLGIEVEASSLSTALDEALFAVKAEPPKPATVREDAAFRASESRPWHSKFTVSMVYLGGEKGFAVINGRISRLGDEVASGVYLVKVKESGVTLKNGSLTHDVMIRGGGLK
jgi:hypothetical protein